MRLQLLESKQIFALTKLITRMLALGYTSLLTVGDLLRLALFHSINPLSYLSLNSIPKVKTTKKKDDKPVETHLLKICKSGFAIDLNSFKSVGFRMAILAASGQGKSYLAGVICEQLLENNSMIVIIDPEGENYTLAERYPMVIVGGPNATIDFSLDEVNPEDLQGLVDGILGNSIPVIFDLSERLDQEQQLLFALITTAVFLAQQKKRRVITLIVDEAHIFAPQQGDKLPETKDGHTSKTISQHIAKRGRKFGIASIWMTQRPAALEKNVLTQCSAYCFGGVQEEVDFKAIRSRLQQAGIDESEIRALKSGQFFYYQAGMTRDINVRTRKCQHGGSAPEQDLNQKRATKAEIADFQRKYGKR